MIRRALLSTILGVVVLLAPTAALAKGARGDNHRARARKRDPAGRRG